MNKYLLRLGVALLATALIPACGSDPEIESFPQMDVSIEAQPNAVSYEFSPDTSGGQLSQQAVVRIRNSGKGPLVLSAVDFVSQNEFIKAVWPGGKPNFPLTLTDGQIQSINIQYKPDPNIEDSGAAQMIIKGNDEDLAEVKLTFSVKQVGAKIVVDNKNLIFTNPSKAAPPTGCVLFGNGGNAPLIFKKAYLSTATPYYQVTETPNEGDTIPALGEGANPKSNPMRKQVCVRISPEAKDADYSAKLIIETNDTNEPKATVVLNVKWEQDNKYTVTCASADGKLKYDFAGVNAGAAERCCNVFNEGPSGFVVNKVEVKALDNGKQDLADALYSTTLYAKNASGDKETVKLPRSISAGKSLDFCVEYTYPSDGKTTNAETIIRFQQANIPDAVQIPVIAGKCETPDLVVAPSTVAVWMDAPLGGKTTRQLLLANQSCAPLQIIQTCVSQVATGSGGQNACSNANTLSQHFFVDPDIGLKAVDPWGTLPIGLRFEPPNDKYTNIQHFLHIVYCGGTWDGNACSEAPVSLTLNVMGYVGSDITLPKLTLTPAEGAEAKVGQPFKIEAGTTDGQWPVGEYGAYLWFLAERPAGSTFWLSSEFQTTDAPWLSIKPDVAGKYKLIGAVQAVNPQKPTEFAWSEHATIEIDVQ
ncbi:MAG: hypothetical protein H6747_06045 [Deltaproteobacteria bacterium]|nr:hypothetical protein [Deltaproteobacteria bacterium]